MQVVGQQVEHHRRSPTREGSLRGTEDQGLHTLLVIGENSFCPRSQSRMVQSWLPVTTCGEGKLVGRIVFGLC